MRVLTCNMHYVKADPRRLNDLLDDVRPDVIALQEWRDSASADELAKGGWHLHRVPGLFLASRYPLGLVERLGLDSTGPQGSAARYELDTPAGVITVYNLHLESPRDALSHVASRGWRGRHELRANSERRREQSEFLSRHAAQRSGPVLVLGDFNTTPESVLFRRTWAGYEDAFEESGLGWGHTFVSRPSLVRIDHVLVGGGGRTRRCWVGPDVGSPHRPVIADIVWPTLELQ